jgi:hypothetical protein
MMLRIHDILARIRMWIRIRGSMPLTMDPDPDSDLDPDPDPDPSIFIDLQDAN